MSLKKGFTVLEVLVSLAIFAILAAAAMSFYQHQSRKGAGAARHKMAQEAATLALMQIKRDILQAGMGLKHYPGLAIFLNEGTGTTPDALYLSFSDHLDLDVTPDIPNSFFDSSGVPGENRAWFKLDSASTSMTVTSVNSSMDKFATAALITRNSAGTASVKSTKDAGFGVSTFNAQHVINGVTYTQAQQKAMNKQDIKYDWTGSFAGQVAPAIEYRLDVDPSHEFPGTLLRNGVAILGAQSTLGGFTPDKLRPLMKVTDFQVRCQFRSGATYVWTSTLNPFTNFNVRDLRLVEVTIRYIIRDEAGGHAYPDDPDPAHPRWPKGFSISGDNNPQRSYGPWKVGGLQTIQVSPRNVVMWVYLSGS